MPVLNIVRTQVKASACLLQSSSKGAVTRDGDNELAINFIAAVAGVTFSDSYSAPVPNFWMRVRLLFKFENPTPVQTPATIIDPTVIHPCFYLRNDHADSCYYRNGKVTPVRVRFFSNLTPDLGSKEKRRILPESTPDPVPPLFIVITGQSPQNRDCPG